MKKTILNQNYSLLVLILLILFITYINIPNVINTNMKGGGVSSNPYDNMPPEKLEEILMQTSGLYKILKTNFNIYIGIVVVLLLSLSYFAFTQFQMVGVPIAGIDPGIRWDVQGLNFFDGFFRLGKTAYGLYTPSSKKNIKPALLTNFEKDTDDLLDKAGSAVDVFCNIVAPCNICSCQGPDPDYGGPSSSAPQVYYEGKDTNADTPSGTRLCSVNTPSVEGFSGPSPSDAAKNIISNKEESGAGDLVISRIPNCCCNLFNLYGIKISDLDRLATAVEPDNADLSQIAKDFNFTIPPSVEARGGLTNSTFPIGIPKLTGCEPSTDPTEIKITGKDKDTDQEKTVSPFSANKGTGDSIYALAMFQGCLSKKPKEAKAGKIVPNMGIAPLQTNKCECDGYDDALDRGISVSSAMTRFVKPTSGGGPSGPYPDINQTVARDVKSGAPSCKSWVSGVWNSMGAAAPKIDRSLPLTWTNSSVQTPAGVGGPNWPSTIVLSTTNTPGPSPGSSDLKGIGVAVGHPAFEGSSIVTSYYYNLDGMCFYLKINNFVHEIDAYPYKTVERLKKKKTFCINDINAANIPEAARNAAKVFLNAGLTGNKQGTKVKFGMIPTNAGTYNKYVSKIHPGHFIFP